MRVIAIGTLREFWRKHAEAEVPLRLFEGGVKDGILSDGLTHNGRIPMNHHPLLPTHAESAI